MNQRGAWRDRDLEAYAEALQDIMNEFGDYGPHKSYDPLSISREDGKLVAHSYVFDLWDGGRHHAWDGDPEKLRKAMLAETVAYVRSKIIP